jgi:hypothetical protein
MNKRNLILLAVFFLVAATAWAQFEMGSIVGLVLDQSNAPVAGASVEIRSADTNMVRQITSSVSGEYNSMPLQPGRYTVTVKQQGFRDQAREVTLSVGGRMEVNFALELGSVNEQITVSATAATVETGSSELSNVRAEREIIDLPVNTRNFTQLVQLAPGVNNHGGNANNSVLQGYTSGRGVNGAVINGVASENVVYLFDGINSMDTDASDVIFFPNMDALAEFKVQTSAAPAAYGGGAGIVNVTFKSGTNEVHGGAYEFVRNSYFDAKNFFDSHVLPIPPFKLNQFGANLAGPVVLPKIINGKNKLFFFVDYEGRRVRQAQSYISTVPIPAFKTGDFSSLLPKTVLKDPNSPGSPLPGNIVPASLINPTSAKLMTLYPAQNLPGAVNNFLFNPMQPTRLDQGDVRIDYRTNNSTLFGRYSYENPDTFTPGYFPAPAVGGGPSRPGDTIVPAEQGVISYGRSFGPSKYYEARIGYSRMYEDMVDEDTVYPHMAEDMGIPNGNAGASGMTNISVSGTTGLGDGSGSLKKFNNNWEFDQALSWVKGRHELKFGVDILTRRFAFFSPSYPNGQFVFNGNYTGYGLADLEFGHPISSQVSATQFFSMKRYQPAFYVQDNFRVSSKLTVNVGLRDDVITAWHERHDRLAGFVPTNGGNFVLVGNAPYANGAVTQGAWLNLGPRFGFAYNLADKTVIRGGYGLYYSYQSNSSGDNQAKNPPYNGAVQVANNANDYADAAPISAGLPAARPTLYPVAGSGYVYWPYNYTNPSNHEWNLNVQRALWSNTVASVAYVGGKGTHVLVFDNCNQPVPGASAVASRRPYPNLGDCTGVLPWGNSSYQSLQATVERRMAGGLTVLASWTYSHSIDDTSGQGGETVQNPYDLHFNRGDSTFDVRQNFVLSWTYELPIGKHLRGPAAILAKGWTVNSIDSFVGGGPFTETMATSTLNAGSATQWPNRIGSGVLSDPSVNMWFNTSAFVAPPAYTYGNNGRNVIFGPGTKQVDFSAFKNFSLGSEARKLQLRAEAFNVLNTPQFDNPNASIGNAAAGIISAAGSPPIYQRTSREIQLALKLYW